MFSPWEMHFTCRSVVVVQGGEGVGVKAASADALGAAGVRNGV
jgi:hypothetical protein